MPLAPPHHSCSLMSLCSFLLFVLVDFVPSAASVRDSCVLSSCWQPVFHLVRVSFVTPFPDYPSPPYIYVAHCEQCIKWNCKKSFSLCLLSPLHLLRVNYKWEMRDERNLVLSEDQCTARLLLKWPGKMFVRTCMKGLALCCPCIVSLFYLVINFKSPLRKQHKAQKEPVFLVTQGGS